MYIHLCNKERARESGEEGGKRERGREMEETERERECMCVCGERERERERERENRCVRENSIISRGVKNAPFLSLVRITMTHI